MSNFSTSLSPGFPVAQARLFQEFQSRRQFSRQEGFAAPPAQLLQAQTPVVDDFFSPEQQLSSKRIISLFTAGMALAVSGRWIWKGLKPGTIKPPGTSQAATTAEPVAPIPMEAGTLLKHQPNRTQELNIAQQFDPFSAMYRLAIFDPSQRPALLAYLGSGIVGFLAGNVAQGAQETWVRRQETLIRAQLIGKIQNVFRESLRYKQAMDNDLKAKAEKRIFDLLQKADVKQAHEIVSGLPLEEPLSIQREYVYQPTHRIVQVPFQGNSVEQRMSDMSRHWLEAGIVGLGAITGFAVQGFIKLFTGKASPTQFDGNAVIYETLLIKDKEAWWLKSLKSPKHLAILAGFLGMSAAARVGKLFIDGLREVEVTRRNARTEYLYQKHNWLTQDPGFHQIAEEHALTAALGELEQQLPWLKNDPAELKHRVQTLLTNIGRNSAPKYFSMTPLVNLVEARG